MLRKVTIVGGGSAGWMAAAYLNGALNNRGQDPKVHITLIESPDIPRISVGEATIPSMRHLLAVIGVDEVDFMRTTDASFKQSIKYVNWVEKNDTFYHHPFSRYTQYPIDTSGSDWAASDRSIPYMETVSAQPIICEMGRGPLTMGQKSTDSALNYAYHMNAQKFADYLRDFSTTRGVIHIEANLSHVKMRDNGFIDAIILDNEQVLESDLFVDCTGFRAKLIGEAVGVDVEDCSQWLLCDRAVTMHVPYETHYPGMVRPYTTASALSNGWIWDIPMQSQRSIGYVHSSAFISSENAEREMRAYQALTSGLTPPQYAAAAKLPEKLAWTYCACVAMHVRDAQKLIARDLRAELVMMRDLRNPVLGGKLTELHAAVAPRLQRPLEYDELRFARVAVMAD